MPYDESESCNPGPLSGNTLKASTTNFTTKAPPIQNPGERPKKRRDAVDVAKLSLMKVGVFAK